MFNIIGDVHSCYEELEDLLAKLTPGRTTVYVGDLIDRGPMPVETLSRVMSDVAAGRALCVEGNHENKLKRYLRGNKVKVGHGLAETIAALDAAGSDFKRKVHDFLESLPYKLILDEGRLVVVHAGIREDMIYRDDDRVRSFCLYGDTDGTKDERGFPTRRNWAADYRGSAVIVHGHVVHEEVSVQNNVWCIDTGSFCGNKLTALQYPEMTLVQVPARRIYQEWK